VLDALSEKPYENTIAEVAKRTGLSCPTVYRYLTMLARVGEIGSKKVGGATIYIRHQTPP
jgi:DNA-binding IclR family transcriptional regulator